MIDITKYSMPAEWEEHARTFIAWPVKSTLIYPENYENIKLAYSKAVNLISEFEPVSVIVNEDTADEAKTLCSSGADIIMLPHNDAWIRDSGPTFVRDKDNNLAGIDWRFNAWGEKYRPML